jgi:hypothetical protein
MSFKASKGPEELSQFIKLMSTSSSDLLFSNPLANSENVVRERNFNFRLLRVLFILKPEAKHWASVVSAVRTSTVKVTRDVFIF